MTRISYDVNLDIKTLEFIIEGMKHSNIDNRHIGDFFDGMRHVTYQWMGFLICLLNDEKKKENLK